MQYYFFPNFDPCVYSCNVMLFLSVSSSTSAALARWVFSSWHPQFAGDVHDVSNSGLKGKIQLIMNKLHIFCMVKVQYWTVFTMPFPLGVNSTVQYSWLICFLIVLKMLLPFLVTSRVHNRSVTGIEFWCIWRIHWRGMSNSWNPVNYYSILYNFISACSCSSRFLIPINFYWQSPEHLLENNGDFFESFSVVIATQLPEEWVLCIFSIYSFITLIRRDNNLHKSL